MSGWEVLNRGITLIQQYPHLKGIDHVSSSEKAMPNNAFEGGRADKQRAFSLHPSRRAAQRKRYSPRMVL